MFYTTRTGTGQYKKAAGRERPATCTCPWKVTRLPKSPRFWQGRLPASSIAPPPTHPFVGEIAAAQRRFGCSSRLKPPVTQTGRSPQPLITDAPPIDLRITIVERLQTGPRLVESYKRIRLAPYIGEWHLATPLIPKATGRYTGRKE